MARAREPRPRLRRSTWIGAGAVTATLAVITTLAVVWPGFDAQQTPVDDATVWAMQNGTGSGYARVNLELGEVDTVKQVENGTTLAQTADRLFVYSDGGAQFSDVNLATPADLTADAEDVFTSTPAGTVDIVTAGDAVVYRTDGGGVYGSTLSGGGAMAAIDPYAGVEVDEGEEIPRFAASAVSVDAEGVVFAYSADDGLLIRAEAATGRVLDQDTPAITPTDAQLTSVSGRWVLYDNTTGEIAVQGRDDTASVPPSATTLVQRAATAGTAVYLADADGVTRVPLDAGDAERVLDAAALGAPAAPTPLGAAVHAAWLTDGTGGGSLWSSDAPDTVTGLDYAGADIGDAVDPAFVGNGARLALNDRASGWVWRVPDGLLVPSSQQWQLTPDADSSDENDERTDRVLDPKPPVAVDDVFGVRAGSIVLLPALLNDHDPNEDVLSIDPSSVSGMDADFGTATVTGAEQQIAVSVSPDASGTARLRYRVTDGTSRSGLLSEPATVTLRVVAEAENSAPQWCGVEECLASWPTLSVAPGGTVTAELLEGWVDPEGDPRYLAGVESAPRVGTVTTTPEGELTYQHPDPHITDAISVQVDVVVSDARGARTTQPLTIEVTPAPELAAESFAVTGIAGQPLEVSVAPYVSGAQGAVAISSLVALDSARSDATANPSALTMTVAASEPGSYLVQYGVRDEVGEVSASVRVTMRAAEEAALSTPPLTAFVRPNEDATIDVAAAASNPSQRVLLLEDIRPSGDPRATLSVDLVGQSLLRVSGSTDDGNPGLLGVVRYRLTDGSTSDPLTAEGAVSVILLPAGSAEPPIAVDDAVTVRAGAQVDIPILGNDHAPDGSPISLDPTSIVNETGGGLAFASGRVLRYLAPDQAGTYAVTYRVYRLGFPEVVDTARVTVTVIGGEDNAAPLPGTLEGRVVAGQSVTIPFDDFAVDPDGDSVTLDAILEQPENGSGSASITADGQAIVYTSPERFSGQVRMTYQVRDSRGATGTGEVKVGVIATQSDPSPVTFSDYVQVQVGEDNSVVVRPTDNDVDPFGSALTLTEVTPNAPAGSGEYRALAGRVASVSEDTVTLTAGDTLGTFSYSYTVTNAEGDAAIGLLVVKVVRDPVPDHPVITDTVLTLENREDFEDGVDVLSGMVTWTGGDPGGLDLRLWGDPDGVRARGWSIAGELPENALLVPFEVTGRGFDGTEVTSYGFLRVPGTADIRLSLRAGLPPLPVVENEYVDFDLADGVIIPDGQSLVLDRDGVRAGGSRPSARCEVVSGTVIRYTAGRGAPWRDACIVPARLQVQDEFTVLTLPVTVEAETPQPILRSASLGVRPGASGTYDLADMVQWAGVEAWDSLEYAVTYRGDQFTVTAEGAQVSVTARDQSRPGREESVTVTLPSHPEAGSASLVLTVGPAPSALPRGGSAERTCSQSGGTSSCVIEVIGAAGEVNPLPGTPLQVVAATGSANCPGVRFAVAGTTAVRATWSSDAEGAASCVGSFTVQDAQGRQSSGDRDGQVILDLRGLPADPTRLDWTAFSADSVTLRVISDAGSYPGVEGYRITTGGREVATCPASGACAPIAAPVGEKRVYEAQALNAVGSSRGSVRAEAWAYRAPAQPTGSSFDPVPSGNAGGVATIVISGLDDTTGRVRLQGGAAGSATQSVSGGTATFPGYQIGSNEPTALVATPLTQFDLPPIAGGSTEGRSLELRAHGVGAPSIKLTQSTTSNSMRVDVRVTAQSSGTEPLFGYSERSAQSCTPDTRDASRSFDAQTFRQKTIYVCATSTFKGDGGFGVTYAEITARPTGNVEAPSGMTFQVSARPSGGQGQGFTYAASGHSSPGQKPFPDAELRYYLNDAPAPNGTFAPRFNSPNDRWTAKWCDSFLGIETNCSDPITITPAEGSADYPVSISTQSVPSCRSDQAAPDWAPSEVGPSVYTVTKTVTDGEYGPRRVEWTVNWIGALDGLNSFTVSSDCEQIPPPEPEPEPTPDPTPTGTP